MTKRQAKQFVAALDMSPDNKRILINMPSRYLIAWCEQAKPRRRRKS